ncbi:hypothetical protein FOZ62_020456 [Perkinsus olseni]|uniref:Uncharacterized protein n=1 Tax=Perkinsus olseni TaxID=32597 RepID=A0A7J6QVR5_PEROL|nr:hypothetical protein FOZ62_020456 [Perkinsus olseni]
MSNSQPDDVLHSKTHLKSRLVPRQPESSPSTAEPWRSPLQYTETVFVHPLEHPMNQLYEGVFKCPLCTTASFLPCGFRRLQEHYFEEHFSQRVNLGAITTFRCRCEWGGRSERTLPLRRARAASEGSLTSPYSGRRSLSTDAFGGSGATSASSRCSTESTSPTESARSLRRQRRTPDRLGEAVPYHYHCPYCEHSCSGTAEEIIMHARVAHRIRVTASDEDCRPREGKREMTLEDPLSPSRLSEGPSDEGSTKKVRFNTQVRVRLMDSDASRVEKLGSILGDDPRKEVFARGWLNAAVESAVWSESSWMSDVPPTTSNDYQQTS